MFNTQCGCALGRRGMLGGAAAALAATAVRAQPSRNWIDVHHHLSPPDYVARIGRRTPLPSLITDWTPAASLADMDRAGIRTAMLSITTPGLWFGDVGEATEVARACNEYALSLVRQHPNRFGSFAALPMPDVAATLAEIAYALDVLHADGVLMFTSHAKWLGDPSMDPVLAELNRRKAVVYTHPAANACCVNLVPGIPDPIIEYGTDTTRAIATLVFSGASQRFPDIRFIFSHAGGTAPFLMDRFRFPGVDPCQCGQVPPRRGGGAAALLLRHGAGSGPRHHGGAARPCARQPGGVRHRLSIPQGPGTGRGAGGMRLHAGGAVGDRPRQRRNIAASGDVARPCVRQGGRRVSGADTPGFSPRGQPGPRRARRRFT